MTPPPENDITVGELSRNMLGMERRLDQRFEEVNRRLDNLQFVPRDVYEMQIRQLKEQVEELLEAKRWTVRTFVAAFMFPVMVAIVVAVAVTR